MCIRDRRRLISRASRKWLTHRVGDMVRSLTHFLRKYITIKWKYTIGHFSCLLWNSTPSSRQDAGGWTGDGGRRVSLETVSPPIWFGPRFPNYLCQWARQLSRVKLAVILWRSMCITYQASKISGTTVPYMLYFLYHYFIIELQL